MNKNDKFHGGITPPECENNVNELSDDELDSVAGGGGTPRTDGKIGAGIKCKSCRTFLSFEMKDQAGYSKNIQCPYCLTTHTVTFHGDGISSELTY